MTADLHLDNAAGGADIQDLAAELVGEIGDILQVLVLVAQSLAGGEPARVEVGGRLDEGGVVGLVAVGLGLEPIGRHLAVVGEQLFKVLGAENVDLGQEELALHEGSVGVVEHGPDGDEILQLAAGLLHDAVLAREHDGHAREILHLGAAHDERVDVEAAGGQNARDAREHAGLVLDQAVEDVALGRDGRGSRGLVEDVGDGRLGGPCWRLVEGERRLAATDGLVGKGRGRAAGAVADGGR